jgi:hypothetical protein
LVKKKKGVKALIFLILIMLAIGTGVWYFFFRGHGGEQEAIDLVKKYGGNIGGSMTIEDVIENELEWINSLGERDFAYCEWKIFGWSAERETGNIYLVGCETRCEFSLLTHFFTYWWRVNIETGEVTPLDDAAEDIQTDAEES